MENHFPLDSGSQRFGFFLSHVSAHHISCMNIRIWINLTLACADMESVTQMTMHKYGIYTGGVSLCLCSCLPTSDHSLKILKENKELAPVILSFMYRNTLSLSGKCFSLNEMLQTHIIITDWAQCLSEIILLDGICYGGKNINISVPKLNHVKGKNTEIKYICSRYRCCPLNSHSIP